MGYGVAVEAWGDYALFTRPEMKVERVSYDCLTPAAARGILEAIYWKPAILWVIDRIHVLKEIEFTNVRRNEVSDKLSTTGLQSAMKTNKPFFLDAVEKRQQRASLLLKNVRYVIEAHFELTDKAAAQSETKEKHYNIALRHLRNGQVYHTPYFGCREFPANFRILEDGIPESDLRGTRDLGWMLYDMDYGDIKNIVPRFFRARMIDGIIDLTGNEVVQ